MAYRCLFMDNEVYTAQDVNDAISNIVLGGVSGYPFGSSAISDLNTAIAELANGGTSYKGTSCLVVKDSGIYKISEGTCIMNDGSQIIFDLDGYEITPNIGVKQYVYLERDVLHNTINVVVADESGGQDTIPLAEIEENGNITDRRRFASASIALSAEPKNIGITKHISSGGSVMSSGASFDVDIGFNGWEYIIFATGSTWGCIKLTDGSSTRAFPTRNGDSSYPDSRNLVTRNGSVLHFENTSDRNSGSIDVEIEVR